MNASPCRTLTARLQVVAPTCKRVARTMRETDGVTSSTVLRVLGALEVTRGGESLPIGGTKAQLLLSVLVAQRNVRLPVDRLVESLWGGDPPKTSTATVQSQVSRLRGVLAPDFQITHRSGGYQLEPTGGEIDADVFERR